jgi:hypothetical protein
MKSVIAILVMVLLDGSLVFCQVAINNNGAVPDNSAGLDINFPDKGLLLPRLTQEQISSIIDPADGLIVYCISDSKFYAYVSNEFTWKEVLFGTNTISPPFTCGMQITVTHLASAGTAPVDKTVTYGTAINVPGEPSKCWITSNLGSDHQAVAVDDTTEASAGWYWQFNHLQGFKHNGLTRTPNTGWITSIIEYSEWTPENDPCTHELGDGWRVPTIYEWGDVDFDGGWSNWNGPWNSLLKLHAAGYLDSGSGSVSERGARGKYWSNTMCFNPDGWNLIFFNTISDLSCSSKAEGIPLRCIKE